MTYDIASAQLRVPSPLARTVFYRAAATPANDNAHSSAEGLDLRVALDYFSQHGLGAAAAARQSAEQAHYDGDAGQYAMWLALCRSFDAPMARQLERSLSHA